MFTVSVSVSLAQDRRWSGHHSIAHHSRPSFSSDLGVPGYCFPTYHPCYQVGSRVDNQSAKNCQLADQFRSIPSGGVVVLQLNLEILRRQHHRGGTSPSPPPREEQIWGFAWLHLNWLYYLSKELFISHTIFRLLINWNNIIPSGAVSIIW